MPKMPINKFFRELDASLDQREASFAERVGEHMAYRAALYIIRGNDASPLERDVDPVELEVYASQLKKLGIGEYAARCYGGLKPENVDLKSLQFAYFLYQNADKLLMPSEMARQALKGELEETLGEIEEGKISFADYWLSRSPAQEEKRNAGDYREEDRSVYEYEAPDEVWKDYVAGSLYRKGMGAVTAKRENVDYFKKSSFDVLTLRNKRTVEKVRRGEIAEFAAARRDTEKSFTFLRPQDLEAAKLEARNLSRQMADCTGAAAETEEWRKLKAAVFSFHTAENAADAAAASADVLLAVEKFTKGKKSSRQPAETAACVDLALKALGTTIPDAARNLSVKPLTDRFNDVRSRRLQKKIEIPGNRYYSSVMPDRECAFLLGRDLTEAKGKASALHDEMAACTGAVTQSPEWQRLTAAVKDFSEAQDVTAAAAASERILEETVKFTKGKKNAQQPPETAACVKLALRSLETAIPSPEQNLKVQALIDRFNEVRADRKQDPVEFTGNDCLPNNASGKEIRKHEQRRLGRFLDTSVNGFLAREGQVPLEEGEMLENIAAAIALEEASEGTMDVRKAFYNRIRELKEDPIVQGMAHRAATDPQELERIRMNSDFEDLNAKTSTFGLYMRETYRRQQSEIREQQSQQADQELLKAREAIENARKELKEKEEAKAVVSPEELEKRETAMDEALLEMGSDYYKLNSYDPEKAAELFAEVLTVKEMRDAQAKGKNPGIREMQARLEALKKDPVVRRMAKTLPRQEKFRVFITACEERNISTVPTLTTALEHAYAAYSKGKQLSECYLEHRDTMRQLGGDFSEEKTVTAKEATHLTASLIALKEVETLSGGKDVTLDEKKLEKRIAQLEQEPVIIQTGNNLLTSKSEEFVGGLMEKKAEPEQVLAGTMYRAFKKQHPEKMLQPGAEAVKRDGEVKPPEAKQDEEIKHEEPAVPVL